MICNPAFCDPGNDTEKKIRADLRKRDILCMCEEERQREIVKGREKKREREVETISKIR